MIAYALVQNNDWRTLAALAERLAGEGWRLGGAVQIDSGPGEGCAGAMELALLPGMQRLRISQPLEPGATGCRLDADAFARAAAAAAAAIGAGAHADAILLSKFGRQEAEGRGLRDAFAAAVLTGRPVLTTVASGYLPAFHEFAADYAEEVPAARLYDWAMAERARR